jgi:hypothetical protein
MTAWRTHMAIKAPYLPMKDIHFIRRSKVDLFLGMFHAIR